MAAHERVVGETLADPNSYGFRPQRSTADAIGYCFNALAKYSSPEWVLEGGIRGCFDNFSHDWLVRNIPMDKALLQRWLQAGFIEKGALFATEAGTPQGGITIYNWSNLFVRLANPHKHHEAITSRPLLLHGVATKTQHGGQTTLTITSQHAKQADSSRADASRGLP